MIHRLKSKHLRRVPELLRCIQATPDWKSVIGAYVARTKLTYPYTVQLRRQGSLRIDDWDELSTFWHVFCCGEYDIPAQCKTIIDLGANIGAFTLWASRYFPHCKIVAVEPFPSTFDRLTRTIGENELGGRVKALNIAVSAVDGIVKFDATIGKRSYCRSVVDNPNQTESIDVECLSLASLLDQNGLTQVDCLKMDVEGGEYAIVEGASSDTLRRFKVITMEYHDSTKAPQLWKKLEASGFRCQRKVNAGWSGLATYVRQDKPTPPAKHA